MKQIDLTHQFTRGTTIASADPTSFRFMHDQVTLEIRPSQAIHYVQNVDKLTGVGFHRSNNRVWLLHGGTHVDLPIEAFAAIKELIEQAYLNHESPPAK